MCDIWTPYPLKGARGESMVFFQVFGRADDIKKMCTKSKHMRSKIAFFFSVELIWNDSIIGIMV